MLYQTTCSFECSTGYERSGSESTTCQLSGSWSPDPPTCELVTCPELPVDAVGSFYPDSCNNGTQPYATVCTLRCPSGYYINYLTVDVPTDSRACQSNGSWEYRDTTPACKDFQPPTLTCPNDTIVNNDAGKNTSSVSWNFTFTDNSLTENEAGVTEDFLKVVLKIGEDNVDTTLPKLLGIGTNTITYVVTDLSGNSASCSFDYTVNDTEAPVCGFCPPDQVTTNATGSEIRVLWDPPVCTDNSGVPPRLFSRRQSGSHFPVPSITEVLYEISDKNGNVNLDCSFRITIESEYLAGREKN